VGPERLERRLRELVERERRLDGNPEKEERRLLKVLAETDAKHPRFQYAFAESVTTLRI
jgi:hypothetical protein